MAKKHPLKVFISYASPDREQAQRLHGDLLGLGVAPWIDTEDLLPGQEWKMAISHALDSTDIVLICLSKNSISKEGYVQKEMRLALDRALEMPPGEVFLIPCRFEECDLPFNLREYQVVDLFSENGMRMLGKSLSARAQKVDAISPNVTGAFPFETKKKPAPCSQTAKKKNDTNVEIHIHGNVTDSNLILGDGNQAEISSKNGE